MILICYLPRRCVVCNELADHFCDADLLDGTICDAPICKDHRIRVGKRDFCPEHDPNGARVAGTNKAAR